MDMYQDGTPVPEHKKMSQIPDSKGRLNTPAMSDRELLEEAVNSMRATQDLVSKFLTDFTSGKIPGPMGMLGKMIGGMK